MRYLKWTTIVGIAIVALFMYSRSEVGAMSDFDISNPLVPLDSIMSGGPGKDGIPAILMPEFIKADEVGDFLKDTDRVMALSVGGEHRAYPIKILNWHEMVNDEVGDKLLLITFCPLCGTGMLFERTVDGKEYSFGVSGLLYESDMIFYDHQTDSLWSQVEGKAITGKMSGKQLTALPIRNTTWGSWKKKHPDTKVLDINTGHKRSYDVNPYEGYDKTPSLMFPVSKSDNRFNPKDMVIGVRVNGKARAYFYNDLAKLETPFEDKIGGRKVDVHFDKEAMAGYITDKEGNDLPAVVGFWFAWYTFNQDTDVYGAK